MFKWKKYGIIYNPTLDGNRPNWRWHYAQGQNALVFDNFIRVYMCCREKPDAKGQTISRIGYVDFKRDDFGKVIGVSERPIIELGEIGSFDEFGQYPFCAVKTGEKIYGYYGGVTRCESVPFNGAIGIGVSCDGGNTFQKIGPGPVLSYSYDEPFCVGSPKVRIFDNRWFMMYSAGKQWLKRGGTAEVCYKLRMATSIDGINWTKYNHNLIDDKIGKDESQACGDIIFKNGKYHMFYCYRKNIDFRRNRNNTYRIGYAWSMDLFSWNREDEKVGIDVSQIESDWDHEMIAYPNVFEIDGRVFMLYLGNQVGEYGFGLAELEGELL